MIKYLHFSKTSLDEPLDFHLCSYFHEQLFGIVDNQGEMRCIQLCIKRSDSLKP